MRAPWLVVASLIAVVASSAHAGETPIPPAPTVHVTDSAGLLSAHARDEIDQQLVSYEQRTGHQVVVWIGTTLGGEDLEDWCTRAFEKWGIGRAHADDGVSIFVFAADHQVRIEVGYGLEGDLPDVVASRIIREVITPRLHDGDADRAIADGVKAVLDQLGSEAAPNGVHRVQAAGRSGTSDWARNIVIGVIVILVLVGAITHPQAALWLLVNLLSSIGRGAGGGWGGGGGGGGDFTGGGGRSGGGGASGSW